MTDQQKKIAEIREALKKATPGPWEAVDIGMPSGAVWRVDAKYMIATAMKKENADIVANAPEWLRFLISEIDRLQQERNKLIEGLRKLAKTNAENLHEIRTWKATQNDPDITDLDWYNHTARNTLEEIGVTVE